MRSKRPSGLQPFRGLGWQLLEHLAGEPNRTLLSPLESNYSSIFSNVLPLLPWMPTSAAIMTIEIILAEEAAREDAATETLGARRAIL